MEQFIGRILKGIYMKDEESFILHIGDEFYLYDLIGDCCSDTYLSDIIKNISLPKYPGRNYYNYNKIEYIIVGYEEIELEEGECKQRETRQEYDKIYGIKLLLECEGDEPNSITIIYRNSSNGYYGGWHDISVVDKIPEGYSLIQYDYSNPF